VGEQKLVRSSEEEHLFVKQKVEISKFSTSAKKLPLSSEEERQAYILEVVIAKLTGATKNGVAAYWRMMPARHAGDCEFESRRLRFIF